MEIKYIEPSVLHDEMLRLRKEKQMDFLECLSGMDWGIPDEKDAPDTPRGLGVVYLLESTVTGERIAVRTATLNREHPELPSVSDIWKAADFNEREVYDFYGIVFIGHPDMRRLYLRNDWVGYPMRKDNEPEKDNPLFSCPNAFITPHLAWATVEARGRLMEIMESNIAGFVNGKVINNVW